MQSYVKDEKIGVFGVYRDDAEDDKNLALFSLGAVRLGGATFGVEGNEEILGEALEDERMIWTNEAEINETLGEDGPLNLVACDAAGNSVQQEELN